MIDAVFHPEYVPVADGHFAKLGAVAACLQSAGLARLHEPGLVNREDLTGLHHDAYLDAFWSGTGKLSTSAQLPWSEPYVRAVRRMVAGQELGMELAFQKGIAANLACGFHHAHPDRGGGFCTINGLAYLAFRHPNRRFVVLDCDEHGGDGTEVFCARLSNLEQFTLFGSRFGTRGGVRSHAIQIPALADRESDDVYLQALDYCLERTGQIMPDVLIYQAGMDVHQRDPKSRLKLATETVVERDYRVLRYCRSVGVPVLIVLAGAYQPLTGIVDLYRRLFQSACSVFSPYAERPASPTLRIPDEQHQR